MAKMKLKNKIDIGREGEDLAVRFLENKNHQIIHRNYRVAHKEVDIISIDEEMLVFTEVKTLTNNLNGYPEEAVNTSKMNFLRYAAMFFLNAYPEYRQVRFDVISICLNSFSGTKDIEYFKDAFY